MTEVSTPATGAGVPVLMYHSVGRVMKDWRWANLTVPASVFEDHLRWLRRAGYYTVGLPEIHAHVRGSHTLSGRPIALTFDDGYVDNWTYAAPLLEKYGFTGTVLVTPDFVHPHNVIRPTLRDAWEDNVDKADLEIRGFMSWAELRAASESGVLSVQSHALTHTWYPVSDTVVDFHHPGDGHYWLDWNAHPEEKPNYLRRLNNSLVPYGVPVYEHRKSLETERRYFPDAGESESLATFVEKNGGEAFFAGDNWKTTLHGVLEEYRSRSASKGHYETEEERAERTRRELELSRMIIEEKLGTTVDHFIWPGGGYDDFAMSLAREVYTSVTIRSKGKWHLANRHGEDPGQVVRRGIPAIERGGVTYVLGGRYLVEFVKEFMSIPGARRRRQALKATYMAGVMTGIIGETIE